MGEMTTERPISEAFDLIAQYAKAQGWIPIGRREFTVGPWLVRVNGTREKWDDLTPFHALIEHADLVAMMVINPFEGTVGGWQDTEAEFCAAMQEALREFPSEGR